MNQPNYQVKPLPFKPESMDGFSKKQMEEHHDVLYAGYVKKLNEIETQITTTSKTDVSPTWSTLRELKTEQVFTTNAVFLHEGYFGNLGGKGGTPTGPVMEMITQDFGSYDKWIEEFKASAMCSRGWVVMAYNLFENRLVNYTTDNHAIAPWACVPLLVLDVYEHSYFTDYGTNRKGYVETFFKHVNWDAVNTWINQFEFIKNRKVLTPVGTR